MNHEQIIAITKDSIIEAACDFYDTEIMSRVMESVGTDNVVVAKSLCREFAVAVSSRIGYKLKYSIPPFDLDTFVQSTARRVNIALNKKSK